MAINVLKYTPCDGKTDDLPGLVQAIADANAKGPGCQIILPAYNQLTLSDIVKLGGASIYGEVDDDGLPLSVIHSLTPLRAAMFLQGDGASIKDLRFTGVPAERGKNKECCRVMVDGATNFIVSGVRVECSAGVSIRMDKSSNGTVERNHVQDSKADSIHMTAETRAVKVLNNTIERSGDDSISVVSYLNAPDVCRDIEVIGNRARDSKSGRFLTVVGGDNVLFEDNHLCDAPATGFYLATEHNGDWETKATTNVRVINNTLVNVGRAKGMPGAHETAVMVVSQTADRPTQNISVGFNVIIANAGCSGVRFSQKNNRELKGDQNVITVVAPATAYAIGDPANATITPYKSGRVGCA